MSQTISAGKPLESQRISWALDLKRNRLIYTLFIPTLIYLVVFHYIPMFGIVISFKDFKPSRGIFGSPWIGLANFRELFTGETLAIVMRNTTMMALLNLTIGFCVPVVLALALSEVRVKPFKRLAQTVSYMPFFVSAMVVCQLVTIFLKSEGGITLLLSLFGLPRQNWLASSNIPIFWLINCFTEIWQGSGYSSIIFIASIASVSGDLHEAAAIDGAGRWKRMSRITLPTILPTIIMMFTLRIGTVFMSGFDKILLLYMPQTYDVADVIHTYTYRMAFGAQVNYGLSAASGLFQSIVSTTLLIISNYLNRRVTKYSLF